MKGMKGMRFFGRKKGKGGTNEQETNTSYTPGPLSKAVSSGGGYTNIGTRMTSSGIKDMGGAGVLRPTSTSSTSSTSVPELAAPTTQMEEHDAQMKQSQVDKDRHAKLTKLAGGYTDVNVIPEERSQETKDAYAEQMKKVAIDTRENQAMLQTTKDMDASALKNIRRGKYTGNIYDSNKTIYGDSRDTITKRDDSGKITEFGSYNKGNFTEWQNAPERRDNYDTAVSGTSTTQKGMKGSSDVYVFEQDMSDKPAPRKFSPELLEQDRTKEQERGKAKLEPGDYRYDELVLGKTPKLTGKQKRQAKRKTNKAARLKKQGERTDAKIMKNNPEFKGLSY